ncbi:MAG: AsmA family protein [Deltaproteobacteria bacterium]|nr:AsmA family protein [Deltaproteobacteria bacterium]
MKLLKRLAIAVVALVVLVGAAFVAAAFFLDLDKVVNAQIAQHKPELEAKLGRKLTVGAVKTEIFPTLGARIDGLTIEPDANHKEDDKPLLQIHDVGFEVSLWDALISRGKDVRIQRVYVDGLEVNVVRYADGRLSYQDILDRQPKGDDAPAKPSEPMSPETLELIKNASIGEVHLGDAQVRFVDYDTPTHNRAEEFIKHLNLEVKDIRVTSPIHVHVDAAIFADAKNFELDTAVGPLPADLQLQGTPPMGETALKVSAVDLARLAPYLGPAVPARIDSAVADADLKVNGPSADGATSLDGFVQVKNVRVAGGTPFEFRTDAKLKADAKKLALDVEKLDIHLGDIAISMSGGLSDLATKPTFRDFTVKSTTLNPGLLYAYYPPAKDGLPPGFKLDGAASLDVKASGDASKQTVNANLDLANLEILDPGALAKPKGVPMGVKVDGTFAGNDAKLERAEAILDQLDLVASGTVKNFASPDFDLQLSAKPFAFDRVARLLPSLKDALEKQHATAQGEGQISGHLEGTLANLDAALNLGLTGVKLDAAGTKLDGALTLKASAKGDPSKNLVADVSIDGQGATIVLPGTLDKAASTPMLLQAHVERSPSQVDVKTFDVKFAELSMHAGGSFDMVKGETKLAVDVAPLDLEKFAKTVTAIPATKAKGGKVDVKVAVQGNPNKLETMTLAIDPLDVKYADSDLRGTLTVRNLVKPDATMNVRCQKLDIDQLLALDDSPAAASTPEQKKKAAEVDNPKLKELTFSGTFDAKELIYSKTDLTNFRGIVHLKDGVLTLSDATFGVYGGSVSAKGTTAEIWKGKMPFHAKLNVKNIDVGQALSAKTKYGGVLQGRGDFNLDLAGEGFETAELEQALTGNIDASLTQGHYSAASLTQSVLGGFGPTLAKIPGMKVTNAQATNAINDLVATFEVKQGKMQLKKPMALALDGGKLTLDGAIGIAGGLFLTGTYGLPGQVLSSVTGGKCKVAGAVPIPVKINGTAAAPAFAPDVAGAASNVLQACLTGKAGEVLDQAKAQAEAQAKAAADNAKQQAAQAAQQAKAQADAQAQAAKQQAQAKADQEKKAADAAAAKAKADADAKAKKAADDAAKKAKDALGGIHF